jgi:four helix bundle protein
LQIENCRLPQEENVMTPDELVERLLNFAARVGKVVDALPDTRMGRHIGGQLVRSGISPAPNYEEGCAAESRAGFVHKLSIWLKELRESRSWIPLIIKTNMLPEHRIVARRMQSAWQHYWSINYDCKGESANGQPRASATSESSPLSQDGPSTRFSVKFAISNSQFAIS